MAATFISISMLPTLPCDHHSASEFLREPEQEGAALAELRGADADALAVADLVAVVEQVDDVETQLCGPAEADRDLLHQRGVEDGVVGQGEVVGRASCRER